MEEKQAKNENKRLKERRAANKKNQTGRKQRQKKTKEELGLGPRNQVVPSGGSASPAANLTLPFDSTESGPIGNEIGKRLLGFGRH